MNETSIFNGIIGNKNSLYKHEFKLTYSFQQGYWVICADSMEEAMHHAKSLQSDCSLQGEINISCYKTFWRITKD